MSAAPLILGVNMFENVVSNPSFILANQSFDDVAGHEAFHVADNLRDLTYWTPAGLNSARVLLADGIASQSPSMVVLDRGHNLKGVVVTITSYTFSGGNYFTQASFTSTIPSTAGGLPSDANGCLTPDGAWWKTFTMASARAWSIGTPAMGAGIAPILTGVYMGASYRFPEYMNAPFADDYDTDVQMQVNRVSTGGLRVMTRKLNYQRLALSVDLESTEYAAFDLQVRPLLHYGQPWWVCFDDSDATHAGMLTPFQLAGNVRYQPNANPVHREVRGLDLEEVLPKLWV